MSGWRDLTSGEEIWLKEIYGNTPDLDRIQLRESGLSGAGAINPWGDPLFNRDAYSTDYRQELDTYERNTFLHEIAHSFQYQNGYQVPILSAIGSLLTNTVNAIWYKASGDDNELIPTGYKVLSDKN